MYSPYILMMLEADFLRSVGKIYTVAVVALIIWIGICFFLISLDKRLRKLEEQVK